MEEPTNATMNKFEEYRVYVEDTARFSDRRQTAGNAMVAVNALLVAGVGALVVEANHGGWWM